MPDEATPYPPRQDAAAPEVWWSESGIDALLWADPRPPYEPPVPEAPAELPALPRADRLQ
jgi:hypothetical protein